MLPRPVPAEFCHDHVEIPVAVEIRRPRIGHASQPGHKHDLLERSDVLLASQPDDAAAVVIVRKEAAQVGHHQIDRSVFVEIARLDVARVVQSRQEP